MMPHFGRHAAALVVALLTPTQLLSTETPAAAPDASHGSAPPIPTVFRNLPGHPCEDATCGVRPDGLAVSPSLIAQVVQDNGGDDIAFIDKLDGEVVLQDHILTLTDSYDDNASFGDKVVLYDQRTGRWVLGYALSFYSPGDIFSGFGLYASGSVDPESHWRGRWFATGGGDFTVLMRLTTWRDAFVVTMFESGGFDYNNEIVAAVHRDDVLHGGTGLQARLRIPIDPGDFTNRLRAVTYESTRPPFADQPPILLRLRDDELSDAPDPDADYIDVLHLDIDWGPTQPTAALRLVATLAIDEIDTTIDPIPQPNGTASEIRDDWVDAPRYRDVDSHESIVMVLPVRADAAVPNRAALYWLELRRTAPGAWQVHQDGRWQADGDASLVGGSAAIDRAGNLLLTGQKLGPSDAPSIVYAGRAADAPAGTLSFPDVTVIQGSGSHGTSSAAHARVVLDPQDACTFWIAGRYFDAAELPLSRLAGVRMPACIPLFADGFESGNAAAWSASTLP